MPPLHVYERQSAVNNEWMCLSDTDVYVGERESSDLLCLREGKRKPNWLLEQDKGR